MIKLWRIEDLDDLLARGCDWLKDYLVTHPNTSIGCPNLNPDSVRR
jgi:hypothetical protein